MKRLLLFAVCTLCIWTTAFAQDAKKIKKKQ